jgi:maltose alpha-D-glucosyltransferase/alpha-amylase
MHWSDRRNGGFSTADPDELVRPVVSGGEFGYEQVNVAAQRRREDSLLSRISRAVSVRKECPELGWGSWTVLDSGDERVLAHRCDWLEGTVVVVHNLADADVDVRLDLGEGVDVEDLIDVFGNQRYDALEGAHPQFRLPAYSYRWLRARRPRSELPL